MMASASGIAGEDRACPACRERNAEEAGEAHGFSMRRCPRCGTLFTAILPLEAEQEDYYDAYYHEGSPRPPPFVDRQLDALVRQLEEWRLRNRWLDVGCGEGGLLRAASRAGWQVTGTEVAPRQVALLTEEGLDVRLGELADSDLESASFDVVTLVEVVEHVRDPGALIPAASRLLRPGGALYLSTPNGRGLAARVVGLRWSAVSPVEHLQLLSVRGLHTLLGDSGLSPLRVRTHGLNPSDIAASARGRVSGDGRVTGGYALNEKLSRGRLGSLFKTAANGALSATRLGDTIKVLATA